MIRKLLSIAVIVAATSFTALSQSNINSKVIVRRDYEGKISGVEKSNLNTEISDTIFNFNLSIDYPTFYRPYKNLYEFSMKGTSDLLFWGKAQFPRLLARLAVAYPWTPAADVYISPRLGNRYSLLFYFNHKSFWGSLPIASLSDGKSIISDDKNFGDRSINKGGVKFGYNWTKGLLTAGIDYSDNYYSFYPVAYYSRILPSDDFNDFNHEKMRLFASHDFNRLNATVSVKSTNADPYSFFYEFKAGYRYIDNVQKLPVVSFAEISSIPLKENGADVKLSLGAVIAGRHRLFVTVQNRLNRFKSVYDGNPVVSTGIWTVKPEYRWSKGRLGIDAGVVISSIYSSDKKNYKLKTNSFIYPDLTVNFNLAKNVFLLYVKAYGKNKLYSQYELSFLNPWFDDKVRNVASSIPIAFELGLKGTVMDKFIYHFYGKYEVVDSLLSFMANDVFNVPYLKDNQILTAGIDLKWNSKNFYAYADFKYHHYAHKDDALMSPSVELNAVAEYNYRRRIFVRADLSCRSSATGFLSHSNRFSQGFYKVPGFADLGIRISYAINPDISVYVEGGNLLNQRIQYFLNYVEPGTNAGVGISMKL